MGGNPIRTNVEDGGGLTFEEVAYLGIETPQQWDGVTVDADGNPVGTANSTPMWMNDYGNAMGWALGGPKEMHIHAPSGCAHGASSPRTSANAPVLPSTEQASGGWAGLRGSVEHLSPGSRDRRHSFLTPAGA